jgi:hypothetical protein
MEGSRSPSIRVPHPVETVHASRWLRGNGRRLGVRRVRHVDSNPFYKEGGHSYFIYQRLFPPRGGGVAYVGKQTIVEEVGGGSRFVLGEAPPFSALAVATFGGGSVGVSAYPRGTRKSYEYAFNVDQKTSESAVWDLAPLGIPEDDVGIPLNYGARFSDSSGTAPLTVLTDIRATTIFALTERRDWSALMVSSR